MTSLLKARWLLSAGSTVCLLGSGCITVSPPSFSLQSLTKQRVEQVAYEQMVEEAPAEPEHPARLKVAYARLMEESGQLVEAHAQYTSAHKLEPKNVDAIMGLARLEQASGNMEEAEAHFRKAIKVGPQNPATHAGLGGFYAAQNQWALAADALNKAMLAAPHDPQYRYQLAVALVHAGDVDSALPHFIRTIGDAEAHYNIALILQQDGKLDDAERHFLTAVTKKPELTQAQQWLTHLQQQRSGSSSPETLASGETSPTAGTILSAGHSSAAVSSAAQSAGHTLEAVSAPPPRS